MKSQNIGGAFAGIGCFLLLSLPTSFLAVITLGITGDHSVRQYALIAWPIYIGIYAVISCLLGLGIARRNRWFVITSLLLAIGVIVWWIYLLVTSD